MMRKGLLAVVAMGAGIGAAPPQPDWSRAQTIEIGMSDFKFDPAQILLTQGTPYVLHFTNTSGGSHEFTAKAFFKAARIAPESLKIAKHGEVELKAGQSAEVRLVAPVAGHYDLHCGKPDHAAMGMVGGIEVR